MDNNHASSSAALTTAAHPEAQVSPTVLRDDLIETAVKFLTNPHVQTTPVHQQRAFLLKKGLSEAEIDAALQRSMTRASAVAPIQIPPSNPRLTVWRDIASTVVIVGGISYFLYDICRKYVLPRWFGIPTAEQEQLQRLEQSINQLNTTVQFLSDSMQQTVSIVQRQQDAITTLVEKIQERPQTKDIDLHEVHRELATVKGILLSRNQFPALPTSNAAPPSLPAWQLRRAETSSSAVDIVDNSADCNGAADDSKLPNGTYQDMA